MAGEFAFLLIEVCSELIKLNVALQTRLARSREMEWYNDRSVLVITPVVVLGNLGCELHGTWSVGLSEHQSRYRSTQEFHSLLDNLG